MAAIFQAEKNALLVRFAGETMRVEAWGPHALRTRARPGLEVTKPIVSALVEPLPASPKIEIDGERAVISNGRIRAELSIKRRYSSDVKREVLIRYLCTRTGKELLAEERSHFAGPKVRNWRALASGSWKLEVEFRAYDDEAFHGLGHSMHGKLNLKGVTSKLQQQNTHVAVPFVVSSRDYGFLWNNPAVGKAEFATNITRWTAESTGGMDYWIVAGESPREILQAYTDATGHAPEIPDWTLGFWQSKLRYRTQNELVDVAREYRRRGIPLSCIVIDFFAWTRQGEWEFDRADWPDPKKMVDELRALGVETMVSIWPTISANSKHYDRMLEAGHLLTTERGVPVVIPFPDKDPQGVGHFTYYDAFNSAACADHWNLVKRNYVDLGIDHFWLDADEPEMRPAHADIVRSSAGNGNEVLCAYPLKHVQVYRDGLDAEGRAGVLLSRSAWAGAQKFGVVLWSGDVYSSWQHYRAQIPAGLNAGMSGIGWWTTDIGGFFEGHGGDQDFRELLIRWFEFGVFSPICRLHGFRVPEGVPVPRKGEPVSYGSDTFNIYTNSGGPNEVWSFGKDVEDVLTGLLQVREALRPYLKKVFAENSRTGDPVMAPVFYHFAGERHWLDRNDCYLLGPELFVAPVMERECMEMDIRLPAGCDWVHVWSGRPFRGGSTAQVDCPPGHIPVFVKKDAHAEFGRAFPALSHT